MSRLVKPRQQPTMAEAIAHGWAPGSIPGRRWDELAAPPIISVALLLLGWGLHVAWGHGWWILTFPPATVGAGVWLAWQTWRHWAKPRDVAVRVLATMGVAWGFTSIAVSIVIGPWGRPWLDIQGWTDLVLIVGVAVSRARVVRGEGHENRGGTEVWDALNLHPATRGHVTASDGRTTTIDVQHGGTQTTTDLQAALPKLEAARRLRPGALRAVPGPVQGTTVLTVTPDDVLAAGPVPAPTLTPRATVTDPVVVGLYEDGVEAVEKVTEGHAVIMGTTGAGKGVSETFTAAQITLSPDVVFWLSSPIKGWQTYAPVRAGVDWFAGTMPEAKAQLAAIRRVIPARTNLLAQLGYREWTRECWTRHRIPFLVIEFEEAGWLIDRDELVEMSERARSAGIRIRFDLQRASHDRMNTSVRSNLGTVRCFGVMSEVDAAFVLPDSALDAGARPDRWRDTLPGAYYLVGKGIPEARWPVPVRAFLPVDAAGREDWSAVQAAVEGYRGRAVLDATTVAAAGEAYARWKGQATRPAPATVPDPVTQPAPEPEPDDDDTYGGYESDLDEETMSIDPRRPIPDWDGDDIPIGLDGTPGQPPPPSERDEHFRAIIAGFAAEGRTRFTTDDILTRWLQIPGMTMSQRPALYERITALIDAGQAERTGRGAYLLLAGAGQYPVTVTDGDDDETSDE